jgi:hypothetical protein
VPFLNAIKTILDAKTQSCTIMLTAEQRLEIKESRNEIEKGLFTEQVELNKKLDQWFNAR